MLGFAHHFPLDSVNLLSLKYLKLLCYVFGETG